MDILFSGEYKSLSTFEWEGLKPLSIITGLNGSGKSQFLFLLHRHFIFEAQGFEQLSPKGKFEVPNLTLSRTEVRYWGSRGPNLPPRNNEFHYSNISQILTTIYEIFHPEKQEAIKEYKDAEEYRKKIIDKRNPHSGIFNEAIKVNIDQISEVLRKLTGKNQKDLLPEEIALYFPSHLLLENVDIMERDSLEMLFYFYQYKLSLAKYLGVDTAYLGSPPWELLDSVLKIANSPFRLIPPDKTKMEEIIRYSPNAMGADRYIVYLRNIITDDVVHFEDLSSGERIIMSIAMQLYYAQERNVSLKLLLLDEPDAHLHPSLTKQFLDVVHGFLVNKHKIQIIMSTHSPSTIAIASQLSDCRIYEMQTKPTKFIHDDSRENYRTISLLTSGLVTVNKHTKYVFVEDEDDVKFYSDLFNFLMKKKLIDQGISIAFISAANGPSVGGGGRTQVEKWVPKFKGTGLEMIIQGIVDQDSKPSSGEPGIHELERYSFENYLLYPIIIYLVLVDEKHPIVPSIGNYISFTTQEDIKTLEEHSAQDIANKIITRLQGSLAVAPAADQLTTKTIKFLNGWNLQYPLWLLHTKGKKEIGLMTAAGNAFGYNKVCKKTLLKMFSKFLDIAPQELLDLIIKVQKFK